MGGSSIPGTVLVRLRIRFLHIPFGGGPFAVYHFHPRWHTYIVPTMRPRYQVTETPAVACALDGAAKRWPGEPRSKLLLRLIEAGGNMLEDDENTEKQADRAAILASAGRYPDAFGPDYLAELRADWPA